MKHIETIWKVSNVNDRRKQLLNTIRVKSFCICSSSVDLNELIQAYLIRPVFFPSLSHSQCSVSCIWCPLRHPLRPSFAAFLSFIDYRQTTVTSTCFRFIARRKKKDYIWSVDHSQQRSQRHSFCTYWPSISLQWLENKINVDHFVVFFFFFSRLRLCLQTERKRHYYDDYSSCLYSIKNVIRHQFVR